MNAQCLLTPRGLLLWLATLAPLQSQTVHGQALEEPLIYEPRWEVRMDMGGSIPQDPNLTRFGEPVSGQRMKLSPGFQMDLAFNYKLTPWLAIGSELGFYYNPVNSFGDFSYHDTSLFQLPMMANVTLEYPTHGRFVPYIGGGVGGVASALTFGEHYGYDYYYHYGAPDGTGSDFTFGFQVFAGFNYRLSQNSHIGVMYRFLYTDSQDWNVEWWTGYRFHVAVDPIQVHSISLVLSYRF